MLHGPPVGEGGYREACHAREGLPVVQGGGENVAGLRKKALRLLAPPQLLLCLFALGYVPEVHRESPRGGVGPARHPSAEDRGYGLELGGYALLHGPLYLPAGLRALGVGELLPDVLAQQPFPGAAPELLGLDVDVGEAPLPIDGVEGVGDAFEYVGGTLPGRPLLG